MFYKLRIKNIHLLTILMVVFMGAANTLYCMGISPYYQVCYAITLHYIGRIIKRSREIDGEEEVERHNESYIKK